MERREEVYLGDAVMVMFNGFSLQLRTDDGNNQQIVLEPQVFAALVEFAKRVDKEYGVKHFFREL